MNDPPTTIACEALRPEGGKCGESAVVHQVRYEYNQLMYRGAGGMFQQELRETQYDIECPRCGRRTQVVKAHAK